MEVGKIKVDYKDKNTEKKIRQEVRNWIEIGKLKDGAEMSEHYQNLLNSIFGTKSISDVSDNDLRVFQAIVDNEYEKHGFKSDLTNWGNHKNEVKKQLSKLNRIQNMKESLTKKSIIKLTEQDLHNIIKEAIQEIVKEEGINIDPKNKGKFTATEKRTGKSASELAHSKNPLTRKRAQFCLNARKWNHKGKKSTNESVKEAGRKLRSDETSTTQLDLFDPKYNETKITRTKRSSGKMPKNDIEKTLERMKAKYDKQEKDFSELEKRGIHQIPMFPEDK